VEYVVSFINKSAKITVLKSLSFIRFLATQFTHVCPANYFRHATLSDSYHRMSMSAAFLLEQRWTIRWMMMIIPGRQAAIFYRTATD